MKIQKHYSEFEKAHMSKEEKMSLVEEKWSLYSGKCEDDFIYVGSSKTKNINLRIEQEQHKNFNYPSSIFCKEHKMLDEVIKIDVESNFTHNEIQYIETGLCLAFKRKSERYQNFDKSYPNPNKISGGVFESTKSEKVKFIKDSIKYSKLTKEQLEDVKYYIDSLNEDNEILNNSEIR